MASRLARTLLVVVLILVLRSLASAGPVPPVNQSALNSLAIFRTLSDSTRIRVTEDNVKGVHAVPDSASGFPAIDTTGHGFRLYYDQLEKTWKLPDWKRRPLSDAGRQAVTVYLLSLNPAVVDTGVAWSVLMDFSRAKIGSVDSSAVISRTLEPVHLDTTTAGWSFAGLSADAYKVPEVPNNAIGINADYGTDNSTGKVLRISGARSGSDLGRAISIEDWSGPAIRLTRRATSTASGNPSLYLDLSPESGGTAAYGIDVDMGGNGNVSGARIVRGDGYRDVDNYGLIIDGTAAADTDSLAKFYALYARAKTDVANGATNIGVYTEANGTGAKALHSVGESHLDGWVRWEKRVDVSLLNGDTIQTFGFAGVDTACRCWGTLRTETASLTRAFGLTVPVSDSVRVTLASALADTIPMTIWCTR